MWYGVRDGVVKGVVVVVRGVGGYAGGAVEVVVDIEYGVVVVQWVWEVVVAAGVSYGVSLDGAAHTHRCCNACMVLRDRVGGWRVGLENSLL